MLKNWFLSFMIIFFSVNAEAREFSLRYDEYVHLSDSDKNKVVIQVMELIVELESKYDYDVKRYGENSPEAETAKEILSQVTRFLSISSAHAASVAPGWKKYADDFKILLHDTKEADCVFAGWPSKTYKLGSRTICSHPSKSTSQKVNGKYPKPATSSSCAKAGTNKIQCNPALFGFQDLKSNSLFCVDASNGAQNSAYHCMKAALGDNNKEARLKMLRENLNSNPEIFAALQKYVYELCVCKATPDGFSQPYHERIRPHRTCYGMMNMLGDISCGPQESELLKDKSIFENLKSTISLSAKQGEIDQLYTKFLSEVPNSAPEEYARMCPDDPSIKVTGPGKDGSSTSGSTGGNPDGGDPDKKPDDKGTDKDPVGDKYACSKAVCTPTKEADVTKPQFACTFVIHEVANNQSVNFDSDPTYEAPKSSEEATLTVKGLILEKEYELSCPTEFSGDATDPEDGKKKPGLAVAVEKKGPKIYVIKAIPTDADGWTLKWTVEAPKELKVPEGWKDPKADKDKKKDVKKPLPGMATDPEEPAETDDPSKKDDPAKTTDPVKTDDPAKTDDPVKTDDPAKTDDPVKTGDPAKTDDPVKTDDPAKTDDPVKTDDPTKTDDPVKTDDPTKTDDPVTTDGDPNKINQDRLKQDYKVCAQLHRGEEKVPETPNCVKVDKVADPPKQGGMMPGQQPMMRRASDTSALGIR